MLLGINEIKLKNAGKQKSKYRCEKIKSVGVIYMHVYICICNVYMYRENSGYCRIPFTILFANQHKKRNTL